MTDQQPHPQRCSNHCVHETKSPFLYGWGCNAVRDDEGRPINITVVEERLINEIGCALYSNHLELPDSCASHSSASEPVPEPNPCEENGCTDIENCDEICEHMRIYSPAYVRESRQKARAEVLDELAEPTIRASEEAAQNGDYVSQTCYEDVLKWIAAIRQQEGKR